MTTIPSANDDWDTHWATLGDAAHETNPAGRFRERLILDRLGALEPGSTIVDIGCGQGEFVLLVKARYPASAAVGIDVSAEGIEHARRRAASVGAEATFLVRDLLRPLDPNTRAEESIAAEYGVCSEVLEHVDDPGALLSHAAAFLAPGSKLVVTVPGGPRTAFDRHIGHRRHFTRRRLTSVLEGAGFDVSSVDAVGFPVFNLYKLLVLMRGRRVIADAAKGVSEGARRSAADVVLRSFDLAFGHQPALRRGGWQIVAVARRPPA